MGSHAAIRTAPKLASKRAGKAPDAAKPAALPRTPVHAAAPGGKLPRPASKRGLLLAALRTAKGISLEEMQKRFAWKPNDCADALRLLAKKNGVAVARREDGRWRVAK